MSPTFRGRLKEILKQDESYIENDGFSNKVLGSLPKRKRMSWSAKRRLIKALSAILGLALSIMIIGGIEFDPEFLQGGYSTALMTFSAIGVSALLAVGCLWVVSDRV